MSSIQPDSLERTYNRINYYDIAKGLGIILVVLAHSTGGSFTDKIINQFHMPLFFLISGLLYSNRRAPLEYAKRKIFSLYIPFAFWNCLSTICKMLFLNANLKLTIRRLIGILLTLTKDGQFFGATWFLAALFHITIFYRFVDEIIEKNIKHIKNVEQKRIILFTLFSLFGVLGFAIDFPFALSRTLILGMFFSIGALVKIEYERLREFDKLPSVVISTVSFFIISSINRIHMGNNDYKFPLLFVMGALQASYTILACSKWTVGGVPRWIKNALRYLGEHSIDILIWQFVAFRIVIIIQLLLEGTQITLANVLQYYPTYVISGGWWIAYFLVGLLVPLLLCSLVRKTKIGKLMVKFHIM